MHFSHMGAAALTTCALLAGCASVNPDEGFAQAAGLAAARGAPGATLARDTSAVSAQVAQALHQPLGVDDAVRIAVINNPGLQARYWDAGIAAADLAQAGRLPNPGLTFKHTQGGGTVAIERTLALDFASILAAPLASRIEAHRYEQVKLEIADAIQKHALETRRAWIEAVASDQLLAYARTVEEAASASAELTGRMARAGNTSALDLAQQQAFQAESQAAALRARQAAVAAHEHLARLMGVSAPFTLPDTLPELPAQAATLPDAEAAALRQRLDLQAEKFRLDATASALGLTRATRFVNVLELGAVHNTETGSAPQNGYEITLEIPLFDWGQARVARAEAVYMQAAQLYAQAAVDARSEAREAWSAYQDAWTIAQQYRTRVVPLRKKVSDEVLLRYNGMLASVFELIADAREQARTVSAAIEAQRDFWLADARLQQALGGTLPATHKEQP
ncbi:MAG: TolC family protein [Telluria sp.]